MKLTTLSTLAAMAALALCVSNAKAVPAATVTNYSRLNITGVITTNLPTMTSGNLWERPVRTTKFGNKQLLDIFAHWADTTWPTGAQLVVGWNSPWYGAVLVVDQTGTNVLFDASSGVVSNETSLAYFYVDFFDEFGAHNESGIVTNPGYYAVTDTGTAYFNFYDDNYYLPYTSISVDGGNKQVFKQTWNSKGAPKGWSDLEIAKFPNHGDQKFLNTGWDITVSGSISASGHGTGYAHIGWAGIE